MMTSHLSGYSIRELHVVDHFISMPKVFHVISTQCRG